MSLVIEIVLPYLNNNNKPWPSPLASCRWKTKGCAHTLTLKPYPGLVKVGLVCKSWHDIFRKLLDDNIWHADDNVFVYAFHEAVGESNFSTWNGRRKVNLHASTFSVWLFATCYAGATITCRATGTPNMHELVGQYGVGDSGATTATFVTAVPAVQYMSDLRRISDKHFDEKIKWKNRAAEAFRVFLQEQHHVSTHQHHQFIQ